MQQLHVCLTDSESTWVSRPCSELGGLRNGHRFTRHRSRALDNRWPLPGVSLSLSLHAYAVTRQVGSAMATNLCAECGIKLSRPEYQKHMQEVHGVSIQHDSDDERDKEAPAAGEDGADAKPQRQRRRGGNKEGAAEGAEGAEEGAAGEDGARPPRERRRRGGRKPAGEGADGEAPAGDFACGDCDRTFASQQGLRRHLQAKHPESEATAAAVAAAAAEAPAAGARRGGRGRGRGTKAEAGEGAADGAAADGAEGAKPAAGGRSRGRGGRTGRGRGAAAAPVPDDPTAAAAMAAAAAKAAIGGAAAEPAAERQVTLFRCKQCEQGFK